ncbi:MAG: hypothetical protein AB1418_00315 [Pseudomonadota bacterium]
MDRSHFQCMDGARKHRGLPKPAYLLTSMRDIELNPVRANRVQEPGQYRWSDYRHNGLCQADARITSHPLYLALPRHDAVRQAAHRALFRSELGEDALSDFGLPCRRGSGWAASVTGSVQRQVYSLPRSGLGDPLAVEPDRRFRCAKCVLDSEKGIERRMTVKK